MKTLFHGTTKENYELIKKNGFAPENPNWNCSYDCTMYFYDLDKAEDYDTKEDNRNQCIRQAFESAQLCAAIQGSDKSELIVFEIQIDESYCSDDESCENMADTATEVNVDDLNEYGKIVNIYSCDAYNKSLRFFYIAGLVKTNDYIRFDFTSMEYQACELIAKLDASAIHDDMHEFDWESIHYEITAVTAVL